MKWGVVGVGKGVEMLKANLLVPPKNIISTGNNLGLRKVFLNTGVTPLFHRTKSEEFSRTGKHSHSRSIIFCRTAT